MKYQELVEKLKRAVLESPGQSAPEVRRAAAFGPGTQVPDALRAYTQKVALHAYKVTDEEVESLKRAGWTEDQLFEVTAAAAPGAAVRRAERGTAVVREAASAEPTDTR